MASLHQDGYQPFGDDIGTLRHVNCAATSKPLRLPASNDKLVEPAKAHIDFPKLKAAALQGIKGLVELRVGKTKTRGNELWFADAPNGKTSLDKASINLTTGKWNCFSTDASGGDAISLIAHLDGVGQGEAAKTIMSELGMTADELAARPKPLTPTKAESDEAEKAEKAYKARHAQEFIAGVKGDDALGLAYLKAKGIDIRKLWPGMKVADKLGQRSDGKSGPALVVPLKAKHDGEVVGVQRIWLSDDGAAKANVGSDPETERSRPARKVLGNAGAFWFGTINPGCDLFVTESIEKAAAINAATGEAVAGMTGASMVNCIEFPAGVRIIAACDNDDAGRKGNAAIAEKARAQGLEVRVVAPPLGMDWDDVSANHDLDALGKVLAEHRPFVDASEVAETAASASAEGAIATQNDAKAFLAHYKDGNPINVDWSKFEGNAFLSPEQMEDLPPITWAIHNVMPLLGVTQKFGFSGTGKSFNAVHLGMCLATGRKYYGHEVDNPAPVLYVALEADVSTAKRISAYLRRYSLPKDTPIYTQRAAVDLITGEGVFQLVALAKQLRARYIIIDTYACATEGIDINGRGDNDPAVKSLKFIRNAVNGHVIIINHTSKGNQEHAAGNGNRALMEADIGIVKAGNGSRVLTFHKVRDGSAEGEAYTFTIESFKTGHFDEKGRPEETGVLVEGERVSKDATKKAPVKLTKNEAVLKKALEMTLGKYGQDGPVGVDGMPDRATVVTFDQLLGEAMKKGFEHYSRARAAKEKISDTLMGLDAKGVAGRLGEYVWLNTPGKPNNGAKPVPPNNQEAADIDL